MPGRADAGTAYGVSHAHGDRPRTTIAAPVTQHPAHLGNEEGITPGEGVYLVGFGVTDSMSDRSRQLPANRRSGPACQVHVPRRRLPQQPP